MTPGELEQARQELGAARQALREARLLLDAEAPQGGASRLYYAVFHAARAALTVHGLHTKTHSGQIGLFEKTFGSAPILGRLLDLRARADYGMAEFTESADRLREALQDTEAFLARCEGMVDESFARGPDEPDPPPDL